MSLKMALASALINASWACAAGEYELSLRALEKGNVILGSDDVLHRRYADITSGYSLHSPGTFLFRRQADQTTSNSTAAGPLQFESTVKLNPDGTIDMAAWDSETESACQEALAKLPVASNPSGTCICYNLPSLDTATGVFEADLRVYKLSEPSGAFAGIAPQNIQVGLMYNGASVSPVEQEKIAGRTVVKRQDTVDPATTTTPTDAASGTTGENGTTQVNGPLQLLQHYLFVGQIDSARMSGDMTMAQFEALVMPVLTLTAVNGTGGQVSTNVSSNEAVFVTGVFSREVVMSDFALASAAVEETIQLFRNKQVAFVLPGVRLMIYPIGLIITSVWLLLGVIAYGIGTYDRIGYAESYRRRTAVANYAGKNTI